MGRTSSDATDSLIAHAGGDARGTEELSAALYAELRRIAGNLMRQERGDHTLQPTALVNEAYLRLINIRRVDWQSKAHFRRMAAKTMRRVLLDYADHHKAKKRGGDFEVLPLDTGVAIGGEQSLELLALDQALGKLATVARRPCEIAELRVFGGLSNREIAHVLGVSLRTVSDDWSFARAWLARELGSPGDDR